MSHLAATGSSTHLFLLCTWTFENFNELFFSGDQHR